MLLPINFHTHETHDSSALNVCNIAVKKDVLHENAKCFTAGIHPWYITDLDERKKELELLALNPACIAIGECGVDKVCTNDQELQKEIFKYQCQLAAKLNKPMIIHAVKSHFDCINILKDHGIKKAVFHGFNSRYTILEKILQEGFMVSFGQHIMLANSPASALIKSVPNELFFLETDDAQIGIITVYETAAKLRGLTIDELIALQHKNFNTFIV